MTDTEGNWHESLATESAPSGSSDRAFGLLFSVVFAIIATFAVWKGRSSALWWLVAAFLSLVVALFAAPLLGPLNRGWRWLSLQLSKILNPIMMGIVFFAVLTPVAMIMRLAGKDPLRLRFEPEKPSYWLARTPVSEGKTSMKDQF